MLINSFPTKLDYNFNPTEDVSFVNCQYFYYSYSILWEFSIKNRNLLALPSREGTLMVY